MPVLMRPVNNFLGQVIGNASEGKYNTVNNSLSGEVTFQKCLSSGITLFSSKNSNKSQTFATGAYQRLHEARPRRVVWLWEPEYGKIGWVVPRFQQGTATAPVQRDVLSDIERECEGGPAHYKKYLPNSNKKLYKKSRNMLTRLLRRTEHT